MEEKEISKEFYSFTNERNLYKSTLESLAWSKNKAQMCLRNTHMFQHRETEFIKSFYNKITYVSFTNIHMW